MSLENNFSELRKPNKDSPLSQWLEFLDGRKIVRKNPNLDTLNILATNLLEKINSPYKITVVGTNGKGSVANFITKYLRNAGYTVGLFTSPHLSIFNERIVVNDKCVSDIELVNAFSLVEKCREQLCNEGQTLDISYFEFITLSGMLIFQRYNLDFWVLEAGIGGRFDAVNIVDADISILTSIALDHIHILGNNIESIGLDKVEVARNSKKLILNEPLVPHTVLERAKEIGANIIKINSQYRYLSGESNWIFVNEISREKLENLPIPNMPLQNAAGAIMLLQCVVEDTGKKLDKLLINKMLKEANLPGRFENLLFNNIPVVLDVAHNPHAVEYLLSKLKIIIEKEIYKNKKNDYSNRHQKIYLHWIISMIADKDILTICTLLLNFLSKFFKECEINIFLLGSYDPRVADPAMIKQILEEQNRVHNIGKNIDIYVADHYLGKDAGDKYALDRIFNQIIDRPNTVCSDENINSINHMAYADHKMDKHMILAFGSFRLVGSIRSYLSLN